MRHSFLLVLPFLFSGLCSAIASADPVTCDAKSEATSVLMNFTRATEPTDGLPQVINRLGAYFEARLQVDRRALRVRTSPVELLQYTKVAACVIAVMNKADSGADLLKKSELFVMSVDIDLTAISLSSPLRPTEKNGGWLENDVVGIIGDNKEAIAQVLYLRKIFGRPPLA